MINTRVAYDIILVSRFCVIFSISNLIHLEPCWVLIPAKKFTHHTKGNINYHNVLNVIVKCTQGIGPTPSH